MKALTLYQPWASLIAESVKDKETRSWPASKDVWGERVAIHAGKSKQPLSRVMATALLEPLRKKQGLAKLDDVTESVPYGAVVATARLQYCVKVTGEDVQVRESGTYTAARDPDGRLYAIKVDPYGDFAVGRWIWKFTDIEKLDEPIEIGGRQRLWNLPKEVEELL